MKENGAFRTSSLHAVCRFFNGFSAAGNDDLAGAVEVDGLNDAACLRNVGADFFDLIFV